MEYLKRRYSKIVVAIWTGHTPRKESGITYRTFHKELRDAGHG